MITIHFIHIKGHQDKGNTQKKLSLPAKLNIECDQHAMAYLPMARCMKPLPNPMIPQCYPHLTINGHTIVRDIQDSLHSAATTQDYQTYMCHKHNWTPKDCDNINWRSMKLAL